MIVSMFLRAVTTLVNPVVITEVVHHPGTEKTNVLAD